MKAFLKKNLSIVAIVVSAVMLSACGNESSSDSDDLNLYDGGAFTINVNPTWNVLPPSEFYPEIPKDTLVAFTYPEAYNGFFINVNVIKETGLPENTTSSDYGQANIRQARQSLTDYTEIQQDARENGTVHIFTARLNPSEPLLRFIQLYSVDGTDGYIVSGGMLTETPEDIRNLVGETVISFKVKEEEVIDSE